MNITISQFQKDLPFITGTERVEGGNALYNYKPTNTLTISI